MISHKISPLAAAVFFASISIHAQEGVPSAEAIEALRRMASQVEKAVPPIKIDSSARTFKDVEKEQREWCDRVLVRPALARIVARGDVPWAADARGFLKSAPDVLFAEQWHAAPTELGQQARKLLQAGCDDLSVLLLAAFADMRCESDWRFVWDCASLALKAIAADPTAPAVLSYHANGLFAWAWQQTGRKKEQSEAEGKVLDAISRMAGDASFQPTETELFLRHLYIQKGVLKTNSDKVRDLAPKLPLPVWAQQTILGIAEVDLAWNARGGGWASGVNAEGWKGFEEHLAKARPALVRAWKENPKSPLAATAMISVVMAGRAESGETERLWFDRAITAQCDYGPAYESLLWAYRPRWCGSHELMFAIGKACLATNRYDLDIPMQFSRACNHIVSEIGDWRAFYRRPEIAKPLMELSEGFTHEPSRAYERPMRVSYLAVNAWLTGDNARAAAALAELGGPLHPDTLLKLRGHRVTESEMREEIAVANSPIAAEFKEAAALYEGRKLVEAGKLFQKIAPSAPGAAGEGVREWLLLIDIEQRLAVGEWVRFPVDAGLRGWLQRGGDWSGTADGTLVNKGSDTGGGIIHRARVGSDFEMRVEFSVDAKEKCCRRCDIYFGWHAGFQEPYNIASFGQPGKFPATARILNSYMPPSGEVKKGIPYKDRNVLLLHSSGRKLAFTVNDKPAFNDYAPADFDFGPPDGRVGIGSSRWCRMNVTSISKIEVRRLGTGTH